MEAPGANIHQKLSSATCKVNTRRTAILYHCPFHKMIQSPLLFYGICCSKTNFFLLKKFIPQGTLRKSINTLDITKTIHRDHPIHLKFRNFIPLKCSI